MKVEEVRNYFKSTYHYSKVTGKHHRNLLNWEKWGFVPLKAQFFLEEFTHGELKANLDHIPRNIPHQIGDKNGR